MASVTAPVPTAPAPGSQRLRRLVALRWVAVAAEISLALLTREWLGSESDLSPVLAICAAQVGLNLAARMFGERYGPPGDGQLFAQVLFDVAALTAIAYLTGGTTNPLIGLYLLWIAVGAAMLDARMAAVLTGLCVACYSILNFVHAQVHVHDPERTLEVHLIGMWLIFVFSAVTISWSVLRLTAAVRQRDAELAQARESALRSERVVALGNLAAGAAHELGTPLATMALIAGEIRRDGALAANLRPDVELLQEQIAECKRIITGLAARAGASRAEGLARRQLDGWLEELLQRWRRQRPFISPRVALEGERPGPLVLVDATVGQAIVSLLNNAADASPEHVEFEAAWNCDALTVRVMDRGVGIAADVRHVLGREPVSTREEGMGMGVVLAYSAIERSGGTLAFAAREGGGTTATLRLALSRLAPPGGG